MSCVACKKKAFSNIYDFGLIPLVNNFTKEKKSKQKI